jgi:hypothetical protein
VRFSSMRLYADRGWESGSSLIRLGLSSVNSPVLQCCHQELYSRGKEMSLSCRLAPSVEV